MINLRIVVFGLFFILVACSSKPEIVEQFFLVQNPPDNDRYYVVFLSYGDSITGHLDVLWGRESSGLESSIETGCFGFYSKQSWLQFTFAKMPGNLLPCSHGYRQTTHRVIFIVSAKIYKSSQDVIRKWGYLESSTNYQLFYRDCVTFAGDVARSLGLNLPKRKLFPPQNWFPASFLKSLVSVNQKMLKQE